MSGDPGWLRVFNTALGGQVSWLIPLALVGLVAGLWVTRRAPRTDKKRAGYLLWGLWSLVMIVVFSLLQGTFHSYYTVVLAPGVAALAGAGCVDLWRLAAAGAGWPGCCRPPWPGPPCGRPFFSDASRATRLGWPRRSSSLGAVAARLVAGDLPGRPDGTGRRALGLRGGGRCLWPHFWPALCLRPQHHREERDRQMPPPAGPGGRPVR